MSASLADLTHSARLFSCQRWGPSVVLVGQRKRGHIFVVGSTSVALTLSA
ncbi:hypothetical protein LX15_004878 [Streptoalloteichus tenebrarius]|uniref:Uncharacterized protein n=1 Tax=Streptoalloteichus tenebrarius (strain ATCC 17920 / DSM 40477 / JCM 4838 / CBS 697.72 / NBRC 16177 / NCIMB 11028 / NRRL B-12390 / A12253. 1 / ISP 5477) TaxID=1933 RepID=A0ABT1I081_STRSD|nr:hypothetical protein [Streptoalloteichus tenebrarius]